MGCYVTLSNVVSSGVRELRCGENELIFNPILSVTIILGLILEVILICFIIYSIVYIASRSATKDIIRKPDEEELNEER